MEAEAEILRIVNGPSPREVPSMTDRIRFSGDAPAVIGRVKEVLLAVLTRNDEWPADDAWPSLLPEWFVSACAPELSGEEAERQVARWRRLPATEQARLAERQPWSLLNWLHWFDPSSGGADRGWRWWSSGSDDDGTGWVEVEISGAPFPSGALRWLLRASGARSLR